MKRKLKISKKILSSTSWENNYKTTMELEEVEMNLDAAYKTRRMNVEKEAIKKLKKNPKFSYNYAKRFSKAHSEIAAFVTKDGELTSDPYEQTEILRQKYKSVASKPMAEFIVEDPNNFFMKDDKGYSLSYNDDKEEKESSKEEEEPEQFEDEEHQTEKEEQQEQSVVEEHQTEGE